MKQQKRMMTVIFYICMLLSVFTSVARADEATSASNTQAEEMTAEDREILASLNDEFSVTLKPHNRE